MQDEYDATVAMLPEMYRTILGRAAEGPITVPIVKVLVGRQTGMWDEMRKLVMLGLLRFVGYDTKSDATVKPRVYELVPVDEVEQASIDGQAWVREVESQRRKSGGNTSESAYWRALAKDRSQRKKRATGNRLEWIRYEGALQDHAARLRGLESKLFEWSAEPEDMAALLHELAKVIDMQARVLEVIEQVADDDQALATIAKLQGTNGRTAAEAKTAQRHIERMKLARRALGDYHDH
jgi:hypothetical protein